MFYDMYSNAQALVAFDYHPPNAAAEQTLSAWFQEFTKLAVRRDYTLPQVADLMTYIAALPGAPEPSGGSAAILPSSQTQRSPYVSNEVIARILRATRIGHNSRNASCKRLASLARSLQVLGYRPDFGFMHNFTQSCRFAWTGFTPQVSSGSSLSIHLPPSLLSFS